MTFILPPEPGPMAPGKEGPLLPRTSAGLADTDKNTHALSPWSWRNDPTRESHGGDKARSQFSAALPGEAGFHEDGV